MPVYEYCCSGCDHRFEELVLRSEKPTCPSCHGSELEKMMSAFAVGDRRPEMAPPSPMAGPGGCGTCGDPAGPGACG